MSPRYFAALVLLPLLAIGGDAAPRDDASGPPSTATQTTRFVLDNPEDFVGTLAFSPDGRTLAAATSYVIVLWDLKTGRKLATKFAATDEDEGGFGRYLVFAPDGKHLATV